MCPRFPSSCLRSFELLCQMNQQNFSSFSSYAFPQMLTPKYGVRVNSLFPSNWFKVLEIERPRGGATGRHIPQLRVLH